MKVLHDLIKSMTYVFCRHVTTLIKLKGVVNWRLHTLYIVGPPNPNTFSTLWIEQGGAS